MAYVKTLWVNDQTPLNADNLNHIEEGIYELSENIQLLFDAVIETQEDFDSMLADQTWKGYAEIALVGQFQASGRIMIPNTVKRIQGFKNASITISSDGISSQQDFAFGYASKPSGNEYEVESLTIICDSTARVGNDSAFQSCIKNCINIRNVEVSQYGDMGNLATNAVYCFNNCDGITNCFSNVITASGIGFYNCSNILNCHGESEAVTYNLFNECRNIVNCNVLLRNKQFQSPSIFTNCSYITNCQVTFDECTSTGVVTGFTFCRNVSNCLSTIVLPSSGNIQSAYGFLGCNKLSSCTSTIEGESETAYKSLYCTFVDISCDIADEKETTTNNG